MQDQVISLIQQCKYKKADKLLDKHKSILSSLDYHELKGVCCFQTKTYKRAVHFWLEGLKHSTEKKRKAQLSLRLAGAYDALNEPDKSIRYLQQSVLADPSITNINARKTLCERLYLRQEWKRFDEFVSPLLKSPDSFIIANQYAAVSFATQGKREQAIEKLKYLVAHFDYLDLKSLSSVLLHLSRLSKTEYTSLLTKAQKKFPSDSVIMAHIGNLYLLDKNFSEAATKMGAINVKSFPDWFNQSWFMQNFASALDKIGKFELAMEWYRKADQFTCEKEKPTILKLEKLDELKDYQLVDWEKSTVHTSQDRSPVFLMGFARSGTTLLENVLATQSQLVAMEEPNTVKVAMLKALNIDPKTLKRGFEFEPKAFDGFREAYFDAARNLVEFSEDSILLDKQPMNTVHLPFIHKMFPRAKILFILRHPLDVCLSCFQQSFALSIQTIHFTDLERTFRRYAQVMELFEKYQSAFDLDIHYVHYEKLIDNFDEEIKSIFDFIGLENADESYKDFYKQTKSKFISTPSREQVSQPIYQGSKNRWKEYAKYIEPMIPIVDRHIKKFGYSVD